MHQNDKYEYIFIDDHTTKHAQDLERIVAEYIQDLQQKQTSQLECSQQLMTRLIDHIRTAYPTDQKKMIELDGVKRTITSEHDRRHVEQNEVIQGLQLEIVRLKTLISNSEYQSVTLINDIQTRYSILSQLGNVTY
jgi:iron-sulfur cluster repair protein YtfE (RIC family)